jgi:hypothetical protein
VTARPGQRPAAAAHCARAARRARPRAATATVTSRSGDGRRRCAAAGRVGLSPWRDRRCCCPVAGAAPLVSVVPRTPRRPRSRPVQRDRRRLPPPRPRTTEPRSRSSTATTAGLASTVATRARRPSFVQGRSNASTRRARDGRPTWKARAEAQGGKTTACRPTGPTDRRRHRGVRAGRHLCGDGRRHGRCRPPVARDRIAPPAPNA